MYLGHAPKHLTEAQRGIWKELKANLSTSLLKAADRVAVEVGVRLTDKMRTTGLNASELAQLINVLGRLGGTPADRLKCAVPVTTPEKSKNEFSEFV